MSYCTTAQLVSLSGSAYDNSTLQAFIDSADRQINARLLVDHVSGSGDGITEASIALSKSILLTRMRLDGTKPASLNMGGVSASDNIDEAIKNLEARAWTLVEQFIGAYAPSRRFHIGRNDR